MKMTATMLLVGGALAAGVIFFIKNPAKFKLMKDMEVDAMNKMNQIIDDN